MSEDFSYTDTLRPASECPIMAMLVDDQAIVGEAVRRLLARQPDIDLHYCPNPLEAVNQAVLIKPTVILLDLIMPQLDGIEVTNQLRANPVTANIPIVVLSTTEDPVVKSQAFAIGADDYLVKLPDKVELIARIRYHSKSYLNQIQRDEAYRALRESQQQLLDSNTALTSLNQAFHEAKEEAERANRAKSDFLSRMSHELRTPLNAILGFSQVLEMENLSTRQQESVGHVLKAGNHLLSLINEMLDIARVESGRISLSLEPILVSRVLNEAMELVRPLSGDLRVEFVDEDSDDAQKHVYADRQRLKQVIINLLSNAIKYNRPHRMRYRPAKSNAHQHIRYRLWHHRSQHEAPVRSI
jgi:signal transduction histidine kinase